MVNTNLERAKELFAKEASLNAAYFTKDGNMFRAEHYARDWAKGANGGEVETITRAEAESGKVKKVEDQNGGDDSKKKGAVVKADQTSEADEKAKLTERYIELFDGKPNNLFGVKKLKELISAKELELDKAAK